MNSVLYSGKIDGAQLNSLRGLACILLVGYHASADVLTYNQVDNSIWTQFHALFTPVRMPLFSFLSGFVYAYKPLQRGYTKTFITGKIRRLALPFFAITFFILALKSVYPSASVPASIFDMPYFLIYGYSHLWFLQAVAWIFFLFALVDYTWPDNKIFTSSAILISGMIGYISSFREIEILSIGGAFYLLPFFAIGVLYNRVQHFILFYRKLIAGLSTAIFLIAFATAYTQVYSFGTLSRFSITGLIMGISAVTSLLIIFPTFNFLSWVGLYSFSIYLFHAIIIAFSIRIYPHAVLFSLFSAILLAIFGSITIEYIIVRRLPMFKWVIGQRYRQQKVISPVH